MRFSSLSLSLSLATQILSVPVSILFSAAVYDGSSVCESEEKNFDCVSCTIDVRDHCIWCGSSCRARSLKSCDTSTTLYPDTCPITWPETPTLLSSWFSELKPVIAGLTLMDIALPGTHDTLSYDLSLTTSLAGIDSLPGLAAFLHNYTQIIPDGIEDYIRQQAQTHAVNITAQLDNGVRFIDFRMMYEYSDPEPDWYSLHFLQSNKRAIEYFKEIRHWMDMHPEEIVVLWLSKHGSTCATGENQYPDTSIAEKQAFWSEIESVFDGLLPNYNDVKLNETSIADLMKLNYRAVIFAADYAEFTGNSSYARDGCDIDNELGPDVTDEEVAIEWEREMFKNAESTRATSKASQKFFLMSMATGVPGEQMFYAAKLKWLGYNETDVEKCAAAFNIPGMKWCPETLLDIGNLENYYKQITLEDAITIEGWGFPMAIYLNSLDWDGTIRTGTQNLWGASRGSSTEQTTAYAYTDTLLLYNVRKGCAVHKVPECDSLIQTLNSRRAKYPMKRWTDSVYGRLEDWP